MKTLSAAAISGVLLATTAVLVPAASAGVETCHGQPATVAPDVDGNLIGTPLADVIVVHENQRVDAGLGDDLICIVSTEFTESVDAGGGADTVDASLSLASSSVFLGTGEDTFMGGPGRDFVYATFDEGYAFPAPDPVDDERDVIATGRGDDQVFSGSLGEANNDKIGTGRGNDRIHLLGLDHDTTLDAGSGNNLVEATVETAETTSWLVNVGKRTLHFDEETSSWSGRIPRWHFELAEGSPRSSLVFIGTSASENAFVKGPGLVPHFRMGGGSDWAGNLDTPGGTYRLGAGSDRLTLGAYRSSEPHFEIDQMRVDLAAGTATFDGDTTSPVTGVETLFSAAVHLRVFGSLRADKVTLNGCNVEARGRAGADLLVRDRGSAPSVCDTVRTRLYGERGNDVLFGSQRTDDYLAGGPGFDRARGMMGIDTCFAEVVRGCEKP